MSIIICPNCGHTHPPVGWVEVATTQPAPYTDVLVVDQFDGEPGVVMAWVDGAGNWFVSDSLTPQIEAPSYWMPLPALPDHLVDCAMVANL